MRILLASDTFDPLVGGVQRVVRDLAGGLVRRGHEVAVVTRAVDGAPEREIVAGIPVRRIRLGLPAWRPRAVLGFLRRRPGAMRAFGSLLSETGAELIHLHFLLSPLAHLAVPWSLRLGVPLIGTAHGRDVGSMLAGDGMAVRTVRRVLTRAAAVTAPSRATLDEALGLVPAASVGLCRVIPNMLPADVSGLLDEPAAAATGPLLAVGELHRKKGFDVLIRAVARIPGLRLRIVGNGVERESLVGLAAGLGVGDRVEFTGAVSREELKGLLRSSMLLAAPSRVEPFGLVILEAFAAGLPVVASRVGGIPEVVGEADAARLVDAGDVVGFAGVIGDLAKDAGLRLAMGARGRVRAAGFTEERTVEGYLRVYRAVLYREPVSSDEAE